MTGDKMDAMAERFDAKFDALKTSIDGTSCMSASACSSGSRVPLGASLSDRWITESRAFPRAIAP